MRPTAFITASCCALVGAPSQAADVTKLLQGEPVLTTASDRGMYDVERCIIGVDAPNMPLIYRQPDRPDTTLIVWDGTGGGLGGVAAAARLDGVERARLTFWGREKFLRRIKPCIGLADPD